MVMELAIMVATIATMEMNLIQLHASQLELLSRADGVEPDERGNMQESNKLFITAIRQYNSKFLWWRGERR